MRTHIQFPALIIDYMTIQVPSLLKLRTITRPNCALDRRTTLRLYVPGFQRQVFKSVPKCQWIPLKKFQWIPHKITCNVVFVGTFVMLRIPQQQSIAICSRFRNCKQIRQNESGMRKCK